MARIEVYLGRGLTSPRIHDEGNPGDDGRHVYVTLTDNDGTAVTIHPAYPMLGDAALVDNLGSLIDTFEQMRDAAKDRIRDREWIAAAKAAREAVAS
jgi:hypothetical protein